MPPNVDLELAIRWLTEESKDPLLRAMSKGVEAALPFSVPGMLVDLYYGGSLGKEQLRKRQEEISFLPKSILQSLSQTKTGLRPLPRRTNPQPQVRWQNPQ